MSPRKPGTVVTLAAPGELLAFDLVAHRGDGLGIGPDEGDAGLGQRLGEGFALGEKAVARMHGLGAGLLAGCDDLVDDQIALRRRRRADQHRLVGHLDMERVAVGVGIDGDGRDAHAPGGLDDAAGDLAAIGNQDLLEHRATQSREPAFCLCGAIGKMSMTPLSRLGHQSTWTLAFSMMTR